MPLFLAKPPEDLDDPSVLIPLLQYLPAMGAVAFHKLSTCLGGVEALLRRPLDQLEAALPSRAREDFRDLYRNHWRSEVGQRYQRDQQLLGDLKAHCITYLDARYPPLLAEIPDCPPQLYVLGDPEVLGLPQLALVGSRKVTPVGADNSFRFADFLAAAGFVITSGLAAGVDAQAHRGALHANGLTVAVMATGIDRVYPAKHGALAREIVDSGGCLITEFCPGSAPLARHFPSRNRLVSGMSLGVLVVEAALRSGSLITARLAMEQNREVYAIPGSIHNPQSRGCHALIKQGAALVETAEDILEELRGWQAPNATRGLSVSGSDSSREESPLPAPQLDREQQQLLQALSYDPVGLDQLAAATGWHIDKLLAQLMTLQIEGVVEQQGSLYQRL